jgi:hypothetical protein
VLRPDSLNIPPASLKAEALTRRPDEYRKTQLARRWCNIPGIPTIMDSFRPIDIQVGEKEVAMPSEFSTSARHIYVDRSNHANPDIYEPLPNGDSIGRWDDGDLLVETTGFSERGITLLPGGGFRTKISVLEERYHVLNDGRNLQVTFTWYDDSVFTTPYTYEYIYYRVPEDTGKLPYSAGEEVCDASQPMRDETLTQSPTAVTRWDKK